MRHAFIYMLLMGLCLALSSFKDPTDSTKTKSTLISNSDGMLLDRFKAPASTKEGMSRQLMDLDRIKTEKINFLSALEQHLMDLNNLSTQIKTMIPPDVDSIWLDIDKYVKSNRSGENNSIIVERVSEIVRAFSKIDYLTYSNQSTEFTSLTNSTSLFSRFRLEKEKIIKRQAEIELVYNVTERVVNSNGKIDAATINRMLKLKSELTTANLKKLLVALDRIIIEEIKHFTDERDKTGIIITKIDSYTDEINKVLTQANVSINMEAIRWGLPLFCATVIILFYGTFLYRRAAAGQSDQVSKILLEVITVLLLTMTVLILGLSGILKENVLGTLLGGIAGYILNKRQNGTE